MQANPVLSSEYLAFTLGREEYALNIGQVREIRNYEQTTRMPTAPEYMKGVINLRGEIIPIIDLRIKLNLGSAVYDETTAVVVTEAAGRTVGFVVDSVSDVLAIEDSQKRPVPDIGARATEYITGLGIVNERTMALVDAACLVD